MNIRNECIPCMLKSIYKLLENIKINEAKQEKILRNIFKFLSEEDYAKCAPKIARGLHKIVKDISGNKDPYKDVKKKYNKLCLAMYNDIKKLVNENNNEFYDALKFSILGNIIDFGIANSFDLDEIIKKFKSMHITIDDSKMLYNDIKQAKTILVLGDNAGEIVYDKLLLETINQSNIYYAVRGNPIINDITREDAAQIGIDKFAKIIDTGIDLPGVSLDMTSESFNKIYEEADLVISKGQGNYECLHEVKDKNIYFLLMVKCELVAKSLNTKVGSIIAKKQNKK